MQCSATGLHWTIQHAALEIARVAHEGLGHTNFVELRTKFNQEVLQKSSDPEVQLRAVTRLLVKMTDARTRPHDTTEAQQIAGLCLMWLATSRVSDWTVLELYLWWILQQTPRI
jgi:hypothetical protein